MQDEKVWLALLNDVARRFGPDQVLANSAIGGEGFIRCIGQHAERDQLVAQPRSHVRDLVRYVGQTVVERR